MKLKEPIEISESTLVQMKLIKKQMLFLTKEPMFMFLKDFKVETVTETKIIKKWFGDDKEVTTTKFILTDCNVNCYFEKIKSWGTLNENGIWRLVTFYDLSQLRYNYENLIKTPLQELGFEIKRIDTNENNKTK